MQRFIKQFILLTAVAVSALAAATAYAKDKVYEADVVVVGAGSSGLSAAVSAAYSGAKVIVLEKQDMAGGSSNLAEGLFAVETDELRKKSVTLTPMEAFKHSMEFNHYRADSKLVHLYLNEGKNTINWLKEQGVEFDPIKISPTEAPVWHLVKDKNGIHHGASLIATMVGKANELGVKILYSTPGKNLIMKDGKVSGVEGTNDKGDRVLVYAKAVILATGGFPNSKEMIAKHTRFNADSVFATAPLDKTGDGINMALAAGADSEGWGLMLHPGTKRPLGPMFAMTWQPSLWVNKYGKRFVDEDVVYSFAMAGNAIERERDHAIWTVFDDATVKYIAEQGIDNGLGVLIPLGTKLPNLVDEMKGEKAKGNKDVAIASSIEDLAKQMGVDPKTLATTVKNYNSYIVNNVDPEFDRDTRKMTPVKTGNFYAIKVYPYFFVSLGGARVNEKMQAINDKDEPINGLYVAGCDVGGLYGDTYTLWASGSAFSFAATSGRIAGADAAKYIKTVK
ncbi:FAD-dependent oxidoreductase [Seleniivibrio woodruffii]|uniref:Fumarate reductase flavoprotein subunit n=1 Tax=Seleniivibrio woodruffii TaxID=1078050 RepID=A0A4R1K657_9BACT|nr:FAD-dependent oxidoreductase [Seleniivibrio woodruffii]TCK59457.1 fumarate reductase flavoprotein subunit [Seleniivibrio woodruffii]TVZ35502.1 fumarate reductase flavoprotein subunit [Seleniivibrio woodruffii]